MTVREWFRKERAAMWTDAAHPCRAVATEIDAVAALITQMYNRNSEYTTVCITSREGTRSRPVELWLPETMYRAMVERDAEEALDKLLLAAWPLADREKYDHTYAMLRRDLGAGPRWDGSVYTHYKGIAD